MLHHNKKRNIGLLNEFFARHIASLLLTKRFDDIEKAKKLHQKYFGPGKILAKEWKMFQSLYTTTVPSEDIACSLIERVREFSKTLSFKELEHEKTRLIHEISNLGDKNFFSRPVPDYKIQATIQVLLNNWHDSKLNESLSEISQLEANLLNHIRTAKSTLQEGDSSYLDMTNDEVDGLVVNLMLEKFNQKFSSELSEEQRNLISKHVFLESPEVKAELVTTLESIRSRTLSLVDKTLLEKKSGGEEIGAPLMKKLNGIKNLLLTEYKDTSKITDESITFFMTLTKLEKELS